MPHDMIGRSDDYLAGVADELHAPSLAADRIQKIVSFISMALIGAYFFANLVYTETLSRFGIHSEGLLSDGFGLFLQNTGFIILILLIALTSSYFRRVQNEKYRILDQKIVEQAKIINSTIGYINEIAALGKIGYATGGAPRQTLAQILDNMHSTQEANIRQIEEIKRRLEASGEHMSELDEALRGVRRALDEGLTEVAVRVKTA